ncbi:zinc finger protein 511-like [Xenia sp. Carnegie-2017]|uniref:zinc finger protein 511-like n=1 Tax=Xenia sp. Carnegie-2017 TaxID=2897299 RepID=UPI001F03FD67|nr:zinc finger protein 511-like [Xenia sp. Carnegie-2017]XP_046852160.1 zinc finger protein 511-like [Xenia sp. Carnegie-2017]
MDSSITSLIDTEINTGVCWSFSPCKRSYLPGDRFFEDGDIFCGVLSKQIFLPTEDLQWDDPSESEQIVCELAGCHKAFGSVASYEAHYNSYHRNTCAECRRTFPSNFLLDLHILENHDVLFKLMLNAKYTYRCLVESCPDKFSNDGERKEHLVTVHKYPANFRFNRPTRKQRKLHTESAESMDTSKPTIDMSSNSTCDLVSDTEMQSSSPEKMEIILNEKRRIPKNVCFGRGSTAAFHRRGKSKGRRK